MLGDRPDLQRVGIDPWHVVHSPENVEVMNEVVPVVENKVHEPNNQTPRAKALQRFVRIPTEAPEPFMNTTQFVRNFSGRRHTHVPSDLRVQSPIAYHIV